MGEARLGEAKVIEHVIQRLSGDGHGERSHTREVGQTALARLMLLAEDIAVETPPRTALRIGTRA